MKRSPGLMMTGGDVVSGRLAAWVANTGAGLGEANFDFILLDIQKYWLPGRVRELPGQVATVPDILEAAKSLVNWRKTRGRWGGHQGKMTYLIVYK